MITQNESGGANVYCPEGSPLPIPVKAGFHTIRDKIIKLSTVEESKNKRPFFHTCANASNYSDCINKWEPIRRFKIVEDPDTTMNIRVTEVQCTPGYYCQDGLRFICPAGRYGNQHGETRHLCSGPASAGHFTPPGSTSPTQYKCGTRLQQAVFCPEGSTTPHPVRIGYWTNSPNVTLRNTSTLCHRNNTDCKTYFYDEMHYPFYNDAGDLDIRTEELPCPAGHWCRDGHRYEIRPGYFGRERYEINPLGNGKCYKGFYCIAASTTPHQYPCGHANVYCPTGSGSPTPVDIGHYTSLGWKYISAVDVINQTVQNKIAPSLKHGNTSIKYEQRLCEVGHWCKDGYREACPKGRYGAVTGLTTELCSGSCEPGYICPVGSYKKDQLECGWNHSNPTSVYCPSGDNDMSFVDRKSPGNTGSWRYIEVSKGHYTIGGEKFTNKTRFAQRPCDKGHYCEGGRKIRCPAGRYGATMKLSNISCSGECDAGYYCPPGSISKQEKICGDVEGVRSPCYVTSTGLVENARRSGERRCEFSHQPHRKRHPELMEDFGNGWKTVHHYEDEFLSFGQPRHYHYHISQHHRSRVKSSGEPASVFCPKGSGLPTGVQYGYYTIGGNETTNKTRVSETICETGYFCEQGMKFRCPPGRYGSAKGLTTEFCSGYCPAGHMCGWNTTTPLECKPGYYASGGWSNCSRCGSLANPRETRTESMQTCRTGRKCCNM